MVFHAGKGNLHVSISGNASGYYSESEEFVICNSPLLHDCGNDVFYTNQIVYNRVLHEGSFPRAQQFLIDIP